MKTLVDTSVWSLVLRKKIFDAKDQVIINEMKSLIATDSILMIGAIRQEILSGIASENTFHDLSKALSKFYDLELHSNVYIRAAEYFNLCRKNGLQGSHTDFLICSFSNTFQVPIFTLDKDFVYYKKYLPIGLYEY